MAINININVDSALLAANIEAQIKKRLEKIEEDDRKKTVKNIKEEIDKRAAIGDPTLLSLSGTASSRADRKAARIRPGGLDRLKQKPAAHLIVKDNFTRFDLPFVAVWLFSDVLTDFPVGAHPLDSFALSETVGGEVIENCHQLRDRRPVDIGAGKVMILKSPNFNTKIFSGHALISGSRANYVESNHVRRDFSGSSTGPFLLNWQKTGSEERPVYPPFPLPGTVGTFYHVYGTLTYEWRDPAGRNVYNPTIMLPVGDNRCILVKCSLTVLNNFFLTAPVYYADTENSDGIPATGYYGEIPNPYQVDFDEFEVQFSWEEALAEAFDPSIHKQFFRLAPGTTVNDITVTPVSSYDFDVKCYLCDNISISEIDCPEALRSVIEASFEIVSEDFTVTVLSSEQDESSINQVTATGIGVNFKDYKLWVNKSTGFNTADGFATFDTSIIPYDWTNFSEQSPGERHGSITTPEVYMKLLEYKNYAGNIPPSSYLSNSLPIPNTLVGSFARLYSEETRNPEESNRGVDRDTWFVSYLNANYLGFAYKGKAAKTRVIPFAGLPNLDEWQSEPPYVFEGDLVFGQEYFFPSVWSIQAADLVYDPREIYTSSSFYYDVSTLGISWTGGNDDFCVLMARALGFAPSITGLTSQEKEEQENS